jgi:hypothetical protein
MLWARAIEAVQQNKIDKPADITSLLEEVITISEKNKHLVYGIYQKWKGTMESHEAMRDEITTYCKKTERCCKGKNHPSRCTDFMSCFRNAGSSATKHCRCGSGSHSHTNHHECKLNPENSKRARIAVATDEHCLHHRFWTSAEDDLLRTAVRKIGASVKSDFGGHVVIPTRTARAAYERYYQWKTIVRTENITDIETFLEGRISVGGRFGPLHLACESYEKWNCLFDEIDAWARNDGSIAAPAAGASLADSREPVKSHDGAREQQLCSICHDDLDGLAADVIIKTRCCAQVFHGACLERWNERERSCPMCKRSIQADVRQWRIVANRVKARKTHETILWQLDKAIFYHLNV